MNEGKNEKESKREREWEDSIVELDAALCTVLLSEMHYRDNLQFSVLVNYCFLLSHFREVRALCDVITRLRRLTILNYILTKYCCRIVEIMLSLDSISFGFPACYLCYINDNRLFKRLIE